jgi:Anti-sigma-K factor rskA
MTDHGQQLPDMPDAELDALIRGALTPAAVRASTRERLLTRARPQVSATPSRAIGALVLALAACLVLLVRATVERDDLRRVFAAADVAKSARIDSLRAVVAERDQFVSALTGPKVSVVGLSAGATKSPRALMFWDKATNRWTFIAHNLAPLQAGRTYQLWLVTASKKISAGTFSVNAGGDATVQATYALDANALKAVAVTEEPAGGMPQPTGAMVVVGTAGSQ